MSVGIKILESDADQKDKCVRNPRRDSFLGDPFRQWKSGCENNEERRIGQKEKVGQKEAADRYEGVGGYPVGGEKKEGFDNEEGGEVISGGGLRKECNEKK
ncbi:hypothetical protein BOTNAR_0162g00090 [Botryotinia narcissicola]|uniref:Uncharacterized protein n=1 Tax=Botryotinia narcissicola TaxID=278944 RepID=A0A4Z1ICQ9_9HELO|nr:hypothetical protein BOTNAR_0162g00090 [Botryotinia narcissicola]